MGNIVDISEVDYFLGELEKASSNLDSQISTVKKSIESINDMKSFSGKAADSAKQYFTGIHLTLLESFVHLFENLKENIKQHKETFGYDVDSRDSALITSEYLIEVKEYMQEVYDELIDEDETIDKIITDVSDISSATSPDFSEVSEWKKNSIKNLKEVEADLEAFISTGDEMDVEETMNRIKAGMSNVQTNKGQSRFTNFSGISSIKDLEQLNAYNKLSGSEGEDLVEEILEKLKDGKTLTSEEKEILFQSIQNELTEEDYKHMNKLSSIIEVEKEGELEELKELKEYVNEKVLYSEASLEEEIILLEKYLYAGNERPMDLPGSTDDRAKLHSYLDILKNHHVAINEVKNEDGLDWSNHDRNSPLLARVENIKLKKGGDTKNNNYFLLNSEISIDYHQEIDEDKGFTRESYIEAPLATGRKNASEVTYYKGSNAISGIINEENEKEQDKLDNMDNEFYRNKFMGYIISGGKEVGKKVTGKSVKVNPVLALSQEVMDIQNHKTEKEEQKHVVNLKGHEEIASNLSVELKINQRDVPYTWSGKSRQIEIYPTDETYETLRRWEALHNEFPDEVPYNKEAVKTENWEEIHNTFGEIDESKHEELYNYIINRFSNGPDYHNVISEIEEELYPRDN